MERDVSEEQTLSTIWKESGLEARKKNISLSEFDPKVGDFGDIIGRLSVVLSVANGSCDDKQIRCPRMLEEILRKMQVSLGKAKQDEVDSQELFGVLRSFKSFDGGVKQNKKRILRARKFFLKKVAERMKEYHDDFFDRPDCEVHLHPSSLERIIEIRCEDYILWKRPRNTEQPDKDRFFGCYKFCKHCREFALEAFEKVWPLSHAQDELEKTKKTLEDKLSEKTEDGAMSIFSKPPMKKKPLSYFM